MNIQTKAPEAKTEARTEAKTAEQRKSEVRSIVALVKSSPLPVKAKSDWKPCPVPAGLTEVLDRQIITLGDCELGTLDLSKAVHAFDNKNKEMIILSSARGVDIVNLDGYHISAKYTIMARKI